MSISYSVKVISDCHIGIKGEKGDDFKLDEQLFLEYLARSIDAYDIVILNGDIFECWEGDLDDEKTLKKIKESRSALFEACTQGGFVKYIFGNHDAIARTGNIETGAISHFVIDMNGASVYFAHGHQSDKANSGCCCCVGRMIAYGVGEGENLIDPDLDIKLSALDNICLSERDKERTANHAFALAEKYGYDAVIYGHTHNPGVEKRNDIIYGNSGRARDYVNMIDEIIVIWTQDTLECLSVRRDIRNDNVVKTYGTQTLTIK